MVDSPSLPPSSGATPPAQAKPSAPPPNAAIISLPPALHEVKDVLQLQGKIVQINADGTVRIDTDQGTIDAKLDPKQAQALHPGDEVDIEIQPGRPPQTARITPEAENAPPRPAPVEPEAPVPPRTVETPVEIDVRPKPVDRPPPSQALPEQPVKVDPIPPRDALAFVSEPVEIITATTQEEIELQAKIIVQEIEQTITQALNTITATPEKTTQTPLPPLASVPSPSQPAPPPVITTQIIPDAAQAVTAPVQPAPPASAFPKILAPLLSKIQIFLQPHQAAPTPVTLQPQALFLSTPATDFTTPASPLTLPVISTPVIPTEIFHARIIAAQAPTGIGTPILQTNAQPLPGFPQTPDLPLILKNQTAGAITATIIARTPEGFPVISIPAPQAAPGMLPNPLSETNAFFILGTIAPALEPGLEITLIPQEGSAINVAMSASPTITPIPLSLFGPAPWPLMDEIYQALNQIMPQAAQAFANTVPSPAAAASRLEPAALFFLAAVRGGDLTQWLGERATDLIRRAGRGGLLSRLGAEGAALNRNEPIAQDWKAMSLPLYWDNEIHRLAFYFRHDSTDGKNAPEGGKQVRFLFDLNLDRMGKVQLDGLFRAKRLDLIVRSENSFSQAMQMKMRQAYIAALEPTEVRGELAFQNKPEQWVTIKSAEAQKFGTSA